LIPIFLVVLVTFFGGTIVQPVLPLYAQRKFGASDSIIPLLNASFFAAQFLAAPFLGRLSDKYGRIPVLIVSQLGSVLSFLLMGFAADLNTLFLARILDGITGGNFIVAQAYITDVTPRKDRTRALGLAFAAFGIGYTFGPPVGGLLSALGDHVPFFAGALITMASTLMVWLMLDESLSAEERLARRERKVKLNPGIILASPSLVLVLLIGFATQMCMSLLQSTFPLFGEKVIFAGEDTKVVAIGVGLLLGMMGVAQFVTQLAVVPRVLPRFGERRTILIGGVLRAVGLLSLVFLVSPYLVGPVSLVMFAVGSGLKMPSLQSLATTCVSEDVCGGVLGVYGSFTSLGIIFGSAISGPLFALAPTMPYLVGSIILMLTLVPATMLLRQERAPLVAQAA
jgi:MFS transporter, DHA1 family, tetracycline resistance protein